MPCERRAKGDGLKERIRDNYLAAAIGSSNGFRTAQVHNWFVNSGIPFRFGNAYLHIADFSQLRQPLTGSIDPANFPTLKAVYVRGT